MFLRVLTLLIAAPCLSSAPAIPEKGLLVKGHIVHGEGSFVSIGTGGMEVNSYTISTRVPVDARGDFQCWLPHRSVIGHLSIAHGENPAIYLYCDRSDSVVLQRTDPAMAETLEIHSGRPEQDRYALAKYKFIARRDEDHTDTCFAALKDSAYRELVRMNPAGDTGFLRKLARGSSIVNYRISWSPVDSGAFNSSYQYRIFFLQYMAQLRTAVYHRRLGKDLKDPIVYVNWLRSFIADDRLTDWLAANHIYDRMVWSKPAVPEKTLAAWLAPIGSPSLREELSGLRASLANTLSPGMPALFKSLFGINSHIWICFPFLFFRVRIKKHNNYWMNWL